MKTKLDSFLIMVAVVTGAILPGTSGYSLAVAAVLNLMPSLFSA